MNLNKRVFLSAAALLLALQPTFGWAETENRALTSEEKDALHQSPRCSGPERTPPSDESMSEREQARKKEVTGQGERKKPSDGSASKNKDRAPNSKQGRPAVQ